MWIRSRRFLLKKLFEIAICILIVIVVWTLVTRLTPKQTEDIINVQMIDE
jgi:hypothetical protein